MKKVLTLLLSGIMVISVMCANFLTVNAEETNSAIQGKIISQTVERLEDGTTITTTLYDTTDAITTRASSYTKSGTKTRTMTNDKGEELWKFTLNGTFSVNSGVSATCTSASHSFKITNTAWQNETATSSKSGNKATGYGKFIRKILFITVETREANLTITCDKNGNLS